MLEAWMSLLAVDDWSWSWALHRRQFLLVLGFLPGLLFLGRLFWLLPRLCLPASIPCRWKLIHSGAEALDFEIGLFLNETLQLQVKDDLRNDLAFAQLSFLLQHVLGLSEVPDIVK